jgi:hypothetical protein
VFTALEVIFTCIFALETLVAFCAFGVPRFFFIFWNVFDTLIVLVSVRACVCVCVCARARACVRRAALLLHLLERLRHPHRHGLGIYCIIGIRYAVSKCVYWN